MVKFAYPLRLSCFIIWRRTSLEVTLHHHQSVQKGKLLWMRMHLSSRVLVIVHETLGSTHNSRK